jgi:hypothetical protein
MDTITAIPLVIAGGIAYITLVGVGLWYFVGFPLYFGDFLRRKYDNEYYFDIGFIFSGIFNMILFVSVISFITK